MVSKEYLAFYIVTLKLRLFINRPLQTSACGGNNAVVRFRRKFHQFMTMTVMMMIWFWKPESVMSAALCFH